MRDRSFADFMTGALACISVLGFYAVVREAEFYQDERRRRALQRWSLPRRRHARSPENDCRHCTGSGRCEDCAPAACRVCGGTGTQPHDRALASRLAAIWDGAA